MTPAQLLLRYGPVLAKQLPKLAFLLTDAKTRERLLGLVHDIASRSPARRVRARVDATAIMAESYAGQAESDSEREMALGWARRARRLAARAAVPVDGRAQGKAHLEEIRVSLDELQGEINTALSDGPAGPG
ncbi:MAG: hypothetical protein ABI249_07400 [Ornithinibacter sp.]